MVILIAKNVAVAANGSVQSAQDGSPQIASLGSPALRNPSQLSLGINVSAATTLAIYVSYDNGATWLAASILGTNTPATLGFSAAGGQAVQITPAPYVKLVSSNAVTLTAWAYAT